VRKLYEKQKEMKRSNGKIKKNKSFELKIRI
jgi:hypothetical protein